MKFEELLTNEDLLDALYYMHFDECTPIQQYSIPAALEGRDLLACAQTGTGKTAAYLLPIIEQLVEDGYPQDCVNCIVMAPTRELAQQIDRQMQGFAYNMPVSCIPVYGGTTGDAYEFQRKSLKQGADIVIATPGRLLSHINMGYVDLSKVSFFVLDEADRMLDMGFLDDIMQIIGKMPKERQTLMFSATMPPKIRMLANTILRDPVEIQLAVSKPADKVEQLAYSVYDNQKIPLFEDILESGNYSKVIVFASSKLKVKELAGVLRRHKLKSAQIHSDLEQTEREDVLLQFKAGKVNVLVATDIISRGIDIDDIELVVNYDVPREAEDYVHRVGRTARADRHGRAVTFINPDDQYRFQRIERLLEAEVPKGVVDEKFGDAPIYNPTPKKKKKYHSHRKAGKSGYSSRKNKKPHNIGHKGNGHNSGGHGNAKNSKSPV